jgi:hypothetical protein
MNLESVKTEKMVELKEKYTQITGTAIRRSRIRSPFQTLRCLPKW